MFLTGGMRLDQRYQPCRFGSECVASNGTDPISYARPEASKMYIAEIKKVTDKPIKYLIYSHHHFDHIAGGKPFKLDSSTPSIVSRAFSTSEG